jgi:hypothetical protein
MDITLAIQITMVLAIATMDFIAKFQAVETVAVAEVGDFIMHVPLT